MTQCFFVIPTSRRRKPGMTKKHCVIVSVGPYYRILNFSTEELICNTCDCVLKSLHGLSANKSVFQALSSSYDLQAIGGLLQLSRQTMTGQHLK